MDVEGSAGLPVDEERIRDAVVKQIQQFGMDKLTSRIIREKLKETFGVDFSAHKAAIDKITMDVIESNAEKEKLERNNGSKSNKSDTESDDGVVFTDRTPRKKPKGTRKRKSSESDSELLEVGQKRRRAAATSKPTAQKRKRPVAETGSKPRKKKNSYNVYCALSEDLSAVCGKRYMRRCDVIKSMWAYFKSNNLLDPKDKRYVLSDEPLMKIIKKRRFLAFGIMKDLVPHIIEPKFLDEGERAALEKYEAEEEARREAEDNAKANGAEDAKPKGVTHSAEKKCEDEDDEEEEDDDGNESS